VLSRRFLPVIGAAGNFAGIAVGDAAPPLAPRSPDDNRERRASRQAFVSSTPASWSSPSRVRSIQVAERPRIRLHPADRHPVV